MRTRLLALSTAAVLLLAAAAPAAASSETLGCNVTATVGMMTFKSSYTATVDSSWLNALKVGGTYSLPSGLTLTVTAVNADTVTLTITGFKASSRSITVECSLI